MRKRTSQRPAVAAKRKRTGSLGGGPQAAAAFYCTSPPALGGACAAKSTTSGDAPDEEKPASRRKSQQATPSDISDILLVQGHSATSAAEDADSSEAGQQHSCDVDAASPLERSPRQDWKLNAGGILRWPAAQHSGAPPCSRMLAYGACTEPVCRAPMQRSAPSPASHPAEAPLQEPQHAAAGPTSDDAQQRGPAAQQGGISELWVGLWPCNDAPISTDPKVVALHADSV